MSGETLLTREHHLQGWKTNGWGHDDFLWYVRGCPNVRKVWEQLHDTEDVICSFDGANIQVSAGVLAEPHLFS